MYMRVCGVCVCVHFVCAFNIPILDPQNQGIYF